MEITALWSHYTLHAFSFININKLNYILTKWSGPCVAIIIIIFIIIITKFMFWPTNDSLLMKSGKKIQNESSIQNNKHNP